MCVLIASFIGLNPIQEEEFKEQFGKIAHKFNYQGEWNRVKEILHSEPFTPGVVLMNYLTDRSPEDFFGNDLKTIKKIYKTLKSVNPYIPRNSKVKYPQRKRGYDDKGHLPGDLHGADIPGTDRKIPREKPSITSNIWFEDTPLRGNNELQGTLVVRRTSSEIERRTPENVERIPAEAPNPDDRRENRTTQETERISRSFNWKTGRQAIEASYIYALTRNRLKTGDLPRFLYYAWLDSKETSFYGQAPEDLKKDLKKFLTESEKSKLLSNKSKWKTLKEISQRLT